MKFTGSNWINIKIDDAIDEYVPSEVVLVVVEEGGVGDTYAVSP